MAFGDHTGQERRHATDDESVAACPVACIGLIDDPEQSMVERMHAEAAFSGVLAGALADTVVQERIVVESAEGIAVVFLTDAGQCLLFALALCAAVRARSDDSLRVRVGLHLGPVRLLQGKHGEPQFRGAGFETGWRSARCAGRGEIVASEPFFEAIAAQSPHYRDCFAIAAGRTGTLAGERPVHVFRAAASPGLHGEGRAPSDAPEGRVPDQPASSRYASLLRRPAIVTTLAVTLVLALALALRQAVQTEGGQFGAGGRDATSSSWPPYPEQAPGPALQTGPAASDNSAANAASSQEASATDSAPGAAGSARDASTQPLPGQPAASVIAAPAATTPPADTAAPVEPRPNAAVARAAPGSAQTPRPSAATGAVRFSIVPWGEIFVDGKRLGAAPPLRDILLPPGVHRIEVRNPGFASHAAVIEIRAGDQIRIRHRFE